MSGAIAMSGMAASRSGAGLVRLAVPDVCVETVAAFSPCMMIVPIVRQDADGRICGFSSQLLDQVKSSDCIAIGPGLGRSKLLDQFVPDLLGVLRCESRPKGVVIDADALNALANTTNWSELIDSRVVLTPHPGEWARLSGIAANDPDGQAAMAVQFAAKSGATVVLKGHSTLVTDGVNSVRNQTGTPAMATGGSGDVLTGVIAALICQGLTPFQAAHLGVHVHGLAGQLAEESLHSHVVLPTELIQFLVPAFARVHST